MRNKIRTMALAVALMFAVLFGKEAPSDEDDTPITPAYDDSAEIATLESRRQAHEAGLARARTEETVRQAELAKSVASKPKSTTPSRGSSYVGKAQVFEATAYTAYCEGCSGTTKTGVDLRKSIYHEDRRVIAVDPRYIPLGSIVRVTLADGSEFEAVAADVGGVIKGAIIDVAHETTQEAYVFGRQTVEVRMIRKGR